MSSPTPSLNRRSSLVDYFASIPKRPRLPSIRSRKSAASSINSKTDKRDSFYVSYSVYQQSMAPTILRDEDATNKLLEAILDSPGGRRALARLARTCKAFKEPCLDLLWRDLDTFVPLLTLFPNGLMKRARRPALGLAKNPEGADWDRVLAYAERVRSITYVEAFNHVSQSVFDIFKLCPREHLLPNLTELTWKAESSPGLNFCRPFLCPSLQSFTLEMGVRAPKINDFLDEVMLKTQLQNFSFTLHSNLPENFVEKMQTNKKFEKLAIMAPGSLAARVGKWASSLPLLKQLQLDLTNSSTRAIEGFFSDISVGSGYSTPSSVGGTDSGIFSGDELDFSEIRKSAVRLTSDGPRRGAFARLTTLNLTGEAANLATFLRHIASPLTQLELAVEDPPPPEDWQDLCGLLGDHFGQTLQSLRISATPSARFTELVRSTSRGGDTQLQHLPLTFLSPLPHLYRLEIELPESAVFHNTDLAHLASVCPALEIVRLCGQARFPPQFGPPSLTLEGIIPLTSHCKRLHTLSVVLHALEGHDETFKHMEYSSRALIRLNVGHSWVKDPLHAAILLSHIAPNLEILRWFAQASRSGVVEQHAATWQKVNDFLGPLQHMRLVERSLKPKVVVREPPKTAEKEVDATVATSSRTVQVSPSYVDSSAHAFPETTSVSVEVFQETTSVGIEAVPAYADYGVGVAPDVVEMSVDAVPEVEEKGVDVLEPEVEVASSEASEVASIQGEVSPPGLPSILPSIQGIMTLPVRAVRLYTYYMTLPLRFMFSFAPSMLSAPPSEPKSPVPGSFSEDEGLSEKRTPSMNHAPPHLNGNNLSMPMPMLTLPSSQNGAHAENGKLADITHPVGH